MEKNVGVERGVKDEEREKSIEKIGIFKAHPFKEDGEDISISISFLFQSFIHLPLFSFSSDFNCMKIGDGEREEMEREEMERERRWREREEMERERRWREDRDRKHDRKKEVTRFPFFQEKKDYN